MKFLDPDDPVLDDSVFPAELRDDYAYERLTIRNLLDRYVAGVREECLGAIQISSAARHPRIPSRRRDSLACGWGNCRITISR